MHIGSLVSQLMLVAVLALACSASADPKYTHKIVVTHVEGLKNEGQAVDEMIQSFKNYWGETDGKDIDVQHGEGDTIVIMLQDIEDALLAKDMFLVHFDNAHTVTMDNEVFKVPHGQEKKRDTLSTWYHEAQMRFVKRTVYKDEFKRLHDVMQELQDRVHREHDEL